MKKKNKGLLLIVSGPSGVGKGTIVNKYREISNVNISISMTTRSKRDNEVDGVNYYFVTKEEFEDNIKKGNFLEYACVHGGEYYGTPKAKIEELLNRGEDVILEIDYQGAFQIKEKFSDAILIFVAPPSMDILLERLTKRNTEANDKIKERYNKAYIEIRECLKYDYVIINDTLNDAVKDLESIIRAEKCKSSNILDLELR